MPSTSHWCRRDIHTLSIYYRLCLSEAVFHRELKKLGAERVNFLAGEGADATAHFFDSKDNKRICIVTLSKSHAKHSLVEVHGLLVHEAMHIWRKHIDYIGEKSPSSEMEAYALQVIAQELMLSYQRQSGRK